MDSTPLPHRGGGVGGGGVEITCPSTPLLIVHRTIDGRTRLHGEEGRRGREWERCGRGEGRGGMRGGTEGMWLNGRGE